MSRFLTVGLVALAMFSIVHGDLLRPCECGPDNPNSCGYCPASRDASRDVPLEGGAARDEARAPC